MYILGKWMLNFLGILGYKILFLLTGCKMFFRPERTTDKDVFCHAIYLQCSGIMLCDHQ